MRPLPLSLALAISLTISLRAQDADAHGDKKKDDKTPASASAGDSPEAALKKFTVAPGLQVDVWAAEPHVTNPVAFSFDEKGRAFVAETFRRRSSALDIRRNTDWVGAVLSHRSVDDRVAFVKEQLAPGKNHSKRIADLNGDGASDWRDLEAESERVRLVEDSDGDGKADRASVLAEGFNSVATGVAAGVLAHGGDVFFACIPDLWRIRDGQRDKLLSGFGVHIAYSGHDMHGVKMGPDGKLYWSIADCGARVTSKEGAIIDTAGAGAVFRANPDGTGFELVMTGLRNPQSLAFNDVGDLFTGDNNADGGDKARWVHVVEGGDAGWRIGWQFLPKLGAWNTEKLWELNTGSTAFSLLPPVAHIGHGPAGIAYYPGTGLPEAYRGHFFYADFPGGIRSFPLKPKGASYTADNPGDILLNNQQKEMRNKLLWALYPSDVGFGVDGGVYVLDWVFGWEKTGKGRIFRVHDPAVDRSGLVQGTKKLLREGLAQRPETELGKLLAHPDQRVRLTAQFTLVQRGEKAAPVFSSVVKNGARDGDALFARLHALWGLGMLMRTAPAAIAEVQPFLADVTPEVRAQAAKVLGDAKAAASAETLRKLLADPEPRVRFFAAQALGKIGDKASAEPLFAMLRENADRDAYLRHAGSLALSKCADSAALAAKSGDPSDAVRAGALLALRRLRSPDAAKFLADKNPQLALEAARAIHDEPIPEAIPQLAALLDANIAGDKAAFIQRRAVNANYLIGDAGAARRLAQLAGNQAGPEAARLDALSALGAWANAAGPDRVLGIVRSIPAQRDAGAATAALGEVFAQIVKSSRDTVRLAALEAAASLKLPEQDEVLLAAVQDRAFSGRARATALRVLGALKSPQLGDAVAAALAENDKTLLAEARIFEPLVSPEKAVERSAALLEKGTTAEKQSALRTLADSKLAAADAVIAQWLDRLLAGKAPAPIHLDLLEAAAKRSDDGIKQKLAAFEAARSAVDPLARWRECLEGGDARIGREVFFEKAEAGCLRCHKVRGTGGDVGPDVGTIGAKHDRAYLLAAIVDPNAVIAPGYDNVMVTLKNGDIVAGLVAAETADSVVLTQVADGSKVTVKKSDVKQRDKVPSAMPPGLGEVLGKRDLRNVVEFLATLK